MHRIRMYVLLGSDREGQCLERPCTPAVHATQQFQDMGVTGQAAHIGIRLPRVSASVG